MDLKVYDFVKGFCIDYMYGVFFGIIKLFIIFWVFFKYSKEIFFIVIFFEFIDKKCFFIKLLLFIF